MKKIIFLCLCVCALLGVSFAQAASAAERIPVAFVCFDYSGNVSKKNYYEFKRQVRQAYFISRYEMIDTLKPMAIADQVIVSGKLKIGRLKKENLRTIAKKSKAKVLVLMAVKAMEEQDLNYSGFRYGNMREREDLTRVLAIADMYVYKVDGDKMLRKNLRSVDTESTPVITPAKEVIKWELRRLVNKMENREQI